MKHFKKFEITLLHVKYVEKQVLKMFREMFLPHKHKFVHDQKFERQAKTFQNLFLDILLMEERYVSQVPITSGFMKNFKFNFTWNMFFKFPVS
jgi:hypothetical protein